MGYIVKYITYFFVENFCVGNFVIGTGIAIQKTPLQMHFSARKFGKFVGGGKFVSKKLNDLKTAKNSI